MTRQYDRRLVRSITVQTPPKKNAELDHVLAFGNVSLLVCVEPNRRKTASKDPRAIDLPGLTADPGLLAGLNKVITTKFFSPLPGTASSSVIWHGHRAK